MVSLGTDVDLAGVSFGRWSRGVQRRSDIEDAREVIEIPTCDQYGIMMDALAKAILDGHEQPVPLEDSFRNMRVIDAVFRSAETASWVDIAPG